MMARMTPVSLHFSDVPTGWKKKIFTDKQQLATGFACSSRTVSPDEHCYRLICASCTQFHVSLGMQAFQLPQAASSSHKLLPRRSSSNLAADASSTYSIRHTATTKQPSSYKFVPLLMHINENKTHRSTTSQTNIGMITMQVSRSHGQPPQRPQEMQHMLKIFVCRSLVFHKHDAMSDICHFIFFWKFSHKWDKTARYHDAVYDTW